jgi:hypothetical protein
MSIKIKLSFNESRRRAAKLLNLNPEDIDNVCPSEGGTKFYVLYHNWRTRGACETFTIWEFLEALPVEKTVNPKDFWIKGADSILAVLGLDKPPSTQREIKSAYRKQVKLHHPDAGGDANKFRELQAAYEFAICLLPEFRKN